MQKAHNQSFEGRLKHALRKAWCIALQTSCQKHPAQCKGFTLIELLIVITIIGILAASLTVSVQGGFKNARQADCKSKLRQIGVAITLYRAEHDNEVPDWISDLFPEYLDDRAVYVCFADRERGRGQVRPPGFLVANRSPGGETIDGPQFRDNETGSVRNQNSGVRFCSYLYEFSAAPTTWRVPNDARPNNAQNPANPYTMGAYKMDQMMYGDNNSRLPNVNGYFPYSASFIPIVRCYHHWNDQRILGRPQAGGAISRLPMVLNVAYAGNVFASSPWWEGMSRLGNN